MTFQNFTSKNLVRVAHLDNVGLYFEVQDQVRNLIV